MDYVVRTPFKFSSIFLLFLMFSLIFMNMQINNLYIIFLSVSVMSHFYLVTSLVV